MTFPKQRLEAAEDKEVLLPKRIRPLARWEAGWQSSGSAGRAASHGLTEGQLPSSRKFLRHAGHTDDRALLHGEGSEAGKALRVLRGHVSFEGGRAGWMDGCPFLMVGHTPAAWPPQWLLRAQLLRTSWRPRQQGSMALSAEGAAVALGPMIFFLSLRIYKAVLFWALLLAARGEGGRSAPAQPPLLPSSS